MSTSQDEKAPLLSGSAAETLPIPANQLAERRYRSSVAHAAGSREREGQPGDDSGEEIMRDLLKTLLLLLTMLVALVGVVCLARHVHECHRRHRGDGGGNGKGEEDVGECLLRAWREQVEKLRLLEREAVSGKPPTDPTTTSKLQPKRTKTISHSKYI